MFVCVCLRVDREWVKYQDFKKNVIEITMITVHIINDPQVEGYNWAHANKSYHHIELFLLSDTSNYSPSVIGT